MSSIHALRVRRLIGGLLAVGSVLAAAPACAADTDFPSRPVRMLVPYPPGGGLDLPGRLVGQKFADQTGQQMVLDNRGGAGGLIAGDVVAKATPDGYTLLLASNGQISMAPYLYAKMPYDAFVDLVPITHFVDTPMALFAATSFPGQSVKEVIALAKGKPGTIGVALSGLGGLSHLNMELFRQRANIDLVGVPYRGAGAAMGDVGAGTVPLIFSTIAGAKPLLESNRIRALAVGARKRTPSLPNTPTFEELGFTGMDVPLWIGMLAPKGTPPQVIAKLNAEFVRALNAPDVKEKLAAQGGEVVASGPREFGETIRRDAGIWKVVIKTANVKLD